MFAIPVLLAAVSLTAYAIPTSTCNASALVDRADPPTPSSYPLGEACGNEWQYLNFDTSSDTDRNHLGTLHNLICSGQLRAYLSWGYKSAVADNNIFKCFFKADPDNIVPSVLSILQGTDASGTFIGDAVARMVIDNRDFGNGIEEIPDCGRGDTFGYTALDPLDSREKTHICQPTWSLPEGFDENTCGAIGDRPTEMVDTIARVAMHEMTHYTFVGESSAYEAQITDQFNNDGRYAYGISRASGLWLQDGRDDKADGNADNYAYMAQVSWAAYRCSGANDDTYGDYFRNCPAPY